jgi:hypothetical protein
MTTKSKGVRLIGCFASPLLVLSVAIGSAGVATAEQVWDVVAWDNCVRNIPDDVLAGEHGNDALRECCWKTGGDWKPTGDPGHDCKAPPADQTGSRSPFPRDVPTHVIIPEPLPGTGPVIAPTPGGVG